MGKEDETSKLSSASRGYEDDDKNRTEAYWHAQRTSAKREITRRINQIKTILDRSTFASNRSQIERLLGIVTEYRQALKKATDELLAFCDNDAEMQSHYKYSDEVNDEIDIAYFAVEEALGSLTMSNDPPKTSTTKEPTPSGSRPRNVDFDDDYEDDVDAHSSVSSSQDQSYILMMSMTFDITKEVPKFDGSKIDEFEAWLTQWNAAEAKLNLMNKTAGEKLLLLKRCLKGNALTFIKNMKDGEKANFKGAKQMLIDYYLDKNVTGKMTVDKLLDLAPMEKDVESIEKVYFELRSIWETLEGLDLSGNQGLTLLFCAIAESKMSPYIRKAWAKKIEEKSDDEHPIGHNANEKDLFNLLNREIKLQRSIASSHRKPKPEAGRPSGQWQNERKETKKREEPKKSHTLPASFSTSTQSRSNRSCLICEKDGHGSRNCRNLKAKNVEERIKLIKQKQLCFICLEKHSTKSCSKPNCDIDGCNKPHARVLHLPKSKMTIATTQQPVSSSDQPETSNTTQQQSNPPITSCSTSSKNQTEQISILKSCLAWAVSPNGERYQVRVFFDNGAEMNLITRKLANMMGLNGKNFQLELTVTGGEVLSKSQEKKVSLGLQSLDGKFSSRKFTASTVEKITAPLKSVPIDPKRYPHLSNLTFTENLPRSEADVDILLGGSMCDDLITGATINGKTPDEPRALPTKLGYVLTGSIPMPKNLGSQTVHCAVYRTSFREIDNKLENFLKLDSIGIESQKTKESNRTLEEELAVDLAEKSTYYNSSEKQWHTSLPFKQETAELPDNFISAKAVLLKGEDTAISTNNKDAIINAYQDMIENEFCERVPTQELEKNQGEVHYLQCHPVFRAHATTTKCRIVMNASAKRKGLKSLNDLLFTGPCLLPDVVQVLLRFRCPFYAFILDISKMFLRIKLDEGKDFLRFLWRNCEKSKQIEVWRMTVVTFGLICSPFLAIFVLMKHAGLFNKKFPLAEPSIKLNTYMDDVSDGANTIAEAKTLLQQIQNLLLEASMAPHKFSANHPDLLTDLPDEMKSTEDKVKVLGVQWNTTSDNLMFGFLEKITPGPATKRSILAQSASIFDPLGLICPHTMRVKLIIQKLWLAQIGWDQNVPPDLQQEWDQWSAEVPALANLARQRCYFDVSRGQPEHVDLYGFGDASNLAFASAIYIVATYKDKSISSELVFAKSRVAPKTIVEKKETSETIVRLELLAALITARAISYVADALSSKLEISGIYCFTDSMITLHRIRRGPDKFKIWIGNRLLEILKLTKWSQWHYVPTALNPGDIPSRGLSANDLINSTLWWHGPDFVGKNQEDWPKETGLSSSDLENHPDSTNDCASNQISAMSAVIKSDLLEAIFNRFSSWNNTVKLFAYILRFGCKAHSQFKQKAFSVNEKESTEMFLWKQSQAQHFSDEIRDLKKNPNADLKRSKLRDYNPTWDTTREVLFSNSRLAKSSLPEATKFPILLPKNCPIVDKYIMHLHISFHHAGPEHVLSLLRQKFRLNQGRRQVKKIIRQCLTKQCTRPKNFQQQMGPLPALRCDEGGAFQNVAVDMLGPMFCRHWCTFENCQHPKSFKTYCALFTCFHSRAIHLELVRDLGTEEFLAALRLFIARRGTPNVMFSDNGTNFKKGSKEIKALYRSINWKKVDQEGVKTNIRWIWNVELAPWANGLTERMVRSVKTPLRIIVGNANLTFRQLSIILTEVEGMINNRPLGTISDHPDDLVPITPAELVIGRKMTQLPDPNLRQGSSSLAHLWRKRQATLNAFWKRWQKDYLLTQDVRKKWHQPTTNDLVGRVVLLKEDSMSRNEWRLGRVIETFQSKDGLVRSVLVKTPTSKLRRPVQRLALLENVF